MRKNGNIFDTDKAKCYIDVEKQEMFHRKRVYAK